MQWQPVDEGGEERGEGERLGTQVADYRVELRRERERERSGKQVA